VISAATPVARTRPSVAPAVSRQTWELDASWQTDAACRGENPDWFFAPAHMERKEERAAREANAKAVCATCPVRNPCLAYAVSTREPHGVWGGLNEIERRNQTARRAG
jgi:WhiB family redox-sensing transcriptional regulator